MVERRKPIPVSVAIDRVMQHVQPLGTEEVALEQAMGRYLAEPIIAKHDVPPFHRSPYDGFAIRSLDSIGASGTQRIAFKVIGEIGAGAVGEKVLGEREAYRVMTGAQLPPGADAVVMFEQTTEQADGFTIRKPFQPGENVSFQGEDARQGEMLIPSGECIHPGTIALLATFGYRTVQVGRQPLVGILATGSELLNIGDELVPGKIRNSNGPMIQAQLSRMGIPSRSYGVVVDDMTAAISTIKQALAETDLLITTGGVSVGDYDYLPMVYERLGAQVLFNKVMMRPGSVTTVAITKGKFLFGLSGNPSACFTGFELFARPAMIQMMGGTAPYLPRLKARLGSDFSKANPFTRFVRAVWSVEKDRIIATPAGFNKSNAVSSIARGNCLIVLPSGTKGYTTGDEVDILLLGMEQGVREWL